MMGYKKLIVAFDGSEGSLRALHHGIDYAKDNGAQLTVINIVKKEKEATVNVIPRPNSTFTPSGDSMYQVTPTAMNPQAEQVNINEAVHDDKVQAKADETLRIAKSELEKEAVQAEVEVLEGDAAEQIDQYAVTNEVDLIVIGSRGLSGLKKFVLGSVSQKVVQNASCPVLVVK